MTDSPAPRRDPSTAWLTPAGEWRFTSYGSQIYGSISPGR
jgi:hypothetical protein